MLILDNIISQESWRILLINWGFSFLFLTFCYLGFKYYSGNNPRFYQKFKVENLDDVNFKEADFTDAIVEELSIQRANFNRANLTNTVFKNINLTGSDFSDAILNNTKFINCVMTDVIIDESKIKILNPDCN